MTVDVVGGVWQYATELATGLRQHDIEMVLAVLGPLPDAAQRQEAEALDRIEIIATGLPLDWLSEAGPVRAAGAEIAALAQRERVDLVHLNSPALAASATFAMPLVGTVHGCLSTWWEAARAGHWHRDMMARGLRACDRIIAPSASYAEVVRRHYGLPTAPQVVLNGRSCTGLPARRALHDCAFTAGRLWDEVKNARLLDAVAARLPFPFHAAGNTRAPHGETAEFQHLHCLGQLDSDALNIWLAARPVFVSAATFEPFGLAVLEAAASGCALVLSDIPTFRELWDDVAIFVGAHDVAGYAAAIETCVQDIELRARLGENARLRAQTYSAERMASATAAHYRDLLTARAAA
ncbi:MAG: glycosyltransferase family 4 protein [Sphingomonadales bacterium]|nr:glycosyltransferase family 4 protein [Sphingomonadales bacterium]